MNFKKIQLEYAYKNYLSGSGYDNKVHTKVLPYLSVVQAVEGNYDIKLGDLQTQNTGDGGFFIAPSDIQQVITHHCDKQTGDIFCRWVFLKLRIDNVYVFDKYFNLPVIVPDEFKGELNQIFNRLFNCNDLFEEYVCYYEILRILTKLAISEKRVDNTYTAMAVEYIKKHYKERLTVELIANNCNLSASRLFAVFKNDLGVSPLKYLNNYRLSLAAERLVNTKNNIMEIADSVGIQDSIYFNKLFKKAYQMPPSEYRDLYKKSES